MGPRLVVIVHGIPAPQGSKTRMPNGALVESSAKVRPWREAVRHTAENAMRPPGFPDESWPDYPLAVHLTFTLPRPRSHYRTGKHAHQLREDAPDHPARRPDLDKLIRSTLDGLTDSGIIADDAAVVILRAVKCYPGGDMDALDTPGAAIVVGGA
jgi:Holliday junction resolvase RusA-like endonuclease